MAALGPLASVLGFTPEAQALMIALYIAMDSFGTACIGNKRACQNSVDCRKVCQNGHILWGRGDPLSSCSNSHEFIHTSITTD